MEQGTYKLSDYQLVEEVIVPNLPTYLSDDFKLAYRNGDSLERVKRALKLIASKSKKTYEATKKQQQEEKWKEK